MLQTIIGILTGLIILSIMMIVHEAGHFFAGLALGFKVKSFNIFMGPILWKKEKNGILYTIRTFPIGASVEFDGELPEGLAGEGANERAKDATKENTRDTTKEPTREGIQEDTIVEAKVEGSPDADRKRGLFYAQPRWARAIVVFMGPFINLLTAFLAFCLLFFFWGTAIPVVDEVLPDSMAAQMQVEKGDKILALNGYKVRTAMDFTLAQMFTDPKTFALTVKKPNGEIITEAGEPKAKEAYRLDVYYDPTLLTITDVSPMGVSHNVLKKGDKIRSINGKTVKEGQALTDLLTEPNDDGTFTVSITRDGKAMDCAVEAKKITVTEPDGLIFQFSSHNLGTSLYQGFFYPVSVIGSTIQAFGKIFSRQLAPQDALGGPVVMVAMMTDVVKDQISLGEKVMRLGMLFGLISVALGFTNLLPIPPLDGSHLFILAIEGILRRDLPMKWKDRLSYVGFALMMLLAVYVLFLDIRRVWF